MLQPRIDGESDEEFRRRAENAARYARVLVSACLRNDCMRRYIEDPGLPMCTVDAVLRNPTVRVEYEQAIVIGCIGEALSASKGKSWGKGPSVLPLEKDDVFFHDRITYLYRDSSLYNRRFEQRRKLKQLLGPERALVREAMRSTRAEFLQRLSGRQRWIIRNALQVDPALFWRAVKGKTFLTFREWKQGDLFADG